MKYFNKIMLIDLCIAMIAIAGPAMAGDALVPFTALLTGGQEVPQNQSNAFGVAFMTFNESTGMLNFSITYTDERLQGTEVAAHFHAPAAPGVNAPVVFGLVNPGELSISSPKVGSVGPLTKDQRRDLEDGLFYLNVHTTVFPGGEIRGQVLPVGEEVSYMIGAEAN